MPRPAMINKGSVPTQPFMKRARRRCEHLWSEYVLDLKKRRYRERVAMPREKTIAFVFGCQRSGTNMMLRTLDRSLDVDRVEETDTRAFRDTRILPKAARNAVLSQSTAKCVVFKPICDSHRALELMAEHPGSKAVWTYRDYRDVANSAVEYWSDQMQQFIEDLLQGGGDWGVALWNREKVTDECLAEVREAAAAGLSPHGAASLFWYMRNRLFFEQKLEDNNAVLLTRYEHLVSDPAAEFKRLCGFLGVMYDADVVARVFSTSIRKRPFPGVNPKIEFLCQGMVERLDAERAACNKSNGQAARTGDGGR